MAKAPFNSPPGLLQKFKIDNLNLEYTIDNISEVPTITYTVQNYYLIPQDWKALVYLVIREVPIPLKY